MPIKFFLVIAFTVFLPVNIFADINNTDNNPEVIYKNNTLEDNNNKGNIKNKKLDVTITAYNNNKDKKFGVIDRYNHTIFKFNKFADRRVLKPVAQFYTNVTSVQVRYNVSNFFKNVETLPIVVNDVLQGNALQAVSDSWRFLINSTVGILGLFDPASSLGIIRHETDLGLTFRKWGWEESRYIILPFFGPSTIRDVISRPISFHYLSLYAYIPNLYTRYGIYLFEAVGRRANLLDLQKISRGISLDPYVFEKNAYLQHRKFLAEQD